MGFGWLLVGYFFANVMSLYSPLSFAMLAGYPMMILGLFHLAHYHTRFQYCWYFSFVSLPFAVYFSLYGFTQLGFGAGWSVLSGTVLSTVEWCYFVFAFLFHALLLYAIAGLTGELELIGLQTGAYRNLLLVVLYYLIDMVARLPITFIQNNKGYLSLPLLLLKLIFVLLNMILIFKCHRHICPEGDETMPDPIKKRKKSKNEPKEEENDEK